MASEKWRLSAQGSPSPRDPRRSAIHTAAVSLLAGGLWFWVNGRDLQPGREREPRLRKPTRTQVMQVVSGVPLLAIGLPEVKWDTPQPGKMSTEARTIGFASVTSECKPQQAATNRAAGRDDCDHGA